MGFPGQCQILHTTLHARQGDIVTLNTIFTHIGPILDDKLKETTMKPWETVLCFHFRVCLCVRGLQSTPFDIETYFLTEH